MRGLTKEEREVLSMMARGVEPPVSAVDVGVSLAMRRLIHCTEQAGWVTELGRLALRLPVTP